MIMRKMNKNLILTLACSMASLGLVAADLPPFWGEEQGARMDWRFDTATNLAPEALSGGAKGGLAIVSPSATAVGWQGEMAGLGDATGFWDLGPKGTVVLTNFNGMGDVSTARYLLVQVVQYMDGGIFNEYAFVNVPGARPLGAEGYMASMARIGGWVTDQTLWALDPGTPLEQIVIAAQGKGAVVDRVVVDVVTMEVQAVGMVVRRVEGTTNRLEVSWEATPAVAGSQLQFTTSLTPPVTWQAVDAPMQTVGSKNLVEVEARQSRMFFRLRK